MRSWLTELRIAVRSLGRRPGFVATCMLTLTIGIGANTAIFSVVNGALLRPLPFPDPNRIVWLSEWWKDNTIPGGSSMNAANFADIRAETRTLRFMSPYTFTSFNLAGDDRPERASGLAVGYRFFDALGVQPNRGRAFTVDEDVRDGPDVTVLTHELWESRFGADPDLVGRDIMLDGEPYTVVGILPSGVEFPGSPRLFVPVGFEGREFGRRGRQVNGIARLTDDATLESARQEVTTLYARLESAYPEENGNWSAWVDPLDRLVVGPGHREALRLLSWSVALVFLIACLNLVNLLLVRSEARQREVALRMALGAGRARLVPHFGGEALVLALGGGALGTGVAWIGMRIMKASFGRMLPRPDEIDLDGRVVAFALTLSLAAGFVAALTPILRTGVDDLQRHLKDGARGSSASGSRLRRALVVGELGLAVILLVTAGLLTRSFARVASVDVGIAEPERVLVGQLSLPSGAYSEPAERFGFYETMLAEVAALPGVRSVGITNRLPLYGGTNFTKVPVIGDPDRFANFVEWRVVTPGFFDAVGIRLEEGRMFGPEELAADTLRAVLATRELARQLFGDASAVGQWIDVFGNGVGLEIIGVVSDLRDLGHERPAPPGVYAPYSPAQANPGAILLARVAGDPMATLPPLRELMAGLDPDLPIYATRTLQDIVDQRLGGRKFSIALLVVFASLAVLLGAIGIYGVMAYAVAQRTQEMGVRMALGAKRNDVLKLVMRNGAQLTILGLVLGLAGAALATRLVRNQLFEVRLADPLTYLVVALVLGGVAMLASYVPARRASSTDPLEALRHE